MSLAIGASLGPYQILAPLGAGGMGEVYRARDTKLHRDVALKVLPQELVADAARLERFDREARALAALNHPHIVTIYSTEEADGIRFLTMELVEGKTLDALIPPEGLPLGRFLQIAIPLADALTAAHQKHITHRDLKPANVMMTADDRVKVLDFGLARVGGADAGDQTLDATRLLTHEGSIVGTMPYMSPEQVEGKPLDHRSDLFSLAIVLYEMLTGGRPFQGQSSPLLMSSIMKDTPLSVRDLRADVPEALARLIDRCLQKQPDDRVQTARDVYNELRHVQKHIESGADRRPDSGSGVARTEESFSVAVLPFTTSGADAETEMIAGGLTEDITAGLSRFPYLAVVAQHSTRQFSGASGDIRLVRQQLGARYILEGTVRRAGNSLRIAARVIDAHNGTQLWSETYNRDLKTVDVLAVQDDVTDRVVATVADVYGVLLRAMSQRLHDRPIEELNASELAMRYWAYQRQHTAAEHGRLRAAFEELVARRPNRADAWGSLAHLYCHEWMFGFNTRPDPLQRAHQAVARALDLDAVDQHAWEALAVTYFFERDRDGFVHAAERAMALNPRNTNTAAWMGNLFVHMGEDDRGCEITERAMALNPNHPGWYYFSSANSHYQRREFAESLRAAKKVNMRDHLWSHWAIAIAAGQLGRSAEAKAALDAFFALAPEFADEGALTLRERWKWDAASLDLVVDGFRKAMQLRQEAVGDAAGMQAAPSPPQTASHGSSAVPSSAVRRPSMAVLPFSDLSPGKDQEWFCDGIAEEILNALTQLTGLHVAARTSAFSFRGKSDDLRAIAEKLGVATVLQGSVRRAGDRVRITVQLVDVSNGFQLWSERYDRELQDIFDVQDEIARAVAGRLRISLAGAGGDRLVTQRTANVDAYELYLKGRSLLYQRGASIVPALEQFRKAVELDPDYAVAWAGIADAYTVNAYFGLVRGAEARRHGLAAARRALELDPASAEAHTALASATLLYECDRASAERSYIRALELNPQYVQGRCWYALFYVQWTTGRFDEGVEEVRKALEADPLSAYVSLILAATLGTAGRHREAVEAARRAVALDPRSFVAQWVLGSCLAWTGDFEEAVSVFEHAAGMSDRHHFALVSLTVAYGRWGKPAQAQAMHREVLEHSARGYVPLTQLSMSADAAGDREQAIVLARQALDEREPPFVLLARHFPDFEPLRADPRFAALIRELDAVKPRS